jgi:hypothetical protein
VLEAVQRLRERADNTGYLKTTEQQKVTKTSVADAPAGTSRSAGAPGYVYTIESASPDTYYLPIYDPLEVYGAWPYSDYQPFSWYPPGYFSGNVLSFAAAAFVGAAIWGNVDWWRGNVNINPLRYNQFNRTNIANNTWSHNPAHRGSVPYRDGNVAQRFGDQSKAGAREAFRGKADAGRRDLAKQGGAGKVADRKADGSSKGKGKASKEASKQAAGKGKASKQAGGKGAGSKKAASTNRAGSKQTSRPRQATGAGQRARSGPSARQARASVPRSPAMSHRGGGGGMRAGGGGRGGGGGGRGGGRRSDITLKHDITLLGHLDNGLGFYRFSYNGSDRVYVGVMAQEVQTLMPEAVLRGRDGYLMVLYDKLGLRFQTYDQWIASGARMPTASPDRTVVRRE